MFDHASSQDRLSRLAFDWRIIRAMRTARYVFSAHRTVSDAAYGLNPIEHERDSRYAVHYRFRYNIRTLVGPGEYSEYTILRVDISNPSYPFVQPASWVVEEGDSRIPYSPHFRRGIPACNGTTWRSDGGYTLGHYAVFLARMLNWDELLDSEYGGWSPDAIGWWRANLNRPIDPDLIYPALPIAELYGHDAIKQIASSGGFRIIAQPTTKAPQGGFRLVATPRLR